MATQEAGRGGPSGQEAPQRPYQLGFMVGWLVFLGMYQIFFAWKFGTFFEGSQGDLRAHFGGAALEPLYAAVGIVALVTAWGGWKLRPWAYRLGWVFQGLIFALALVIIGMWIAGKNVPLGWLVLDCVFGAYNTWWLLRPDVRQAFRAGGSKPATGQHAGASKS